MDIVLTALDNRMAEFLLALANKVRKLGLYEVASLIGSERDAELGAIWCCLKSGGFICSQKEKARGSSPSGPANELITDSSNDSSAWSKLDNVCSDPQTLDFAGMIKS